jgi:hypothetical protein
VPLVTGQQVPTCPPTSQAWHAAPQAPLQQTPSTHWPLAHSCVDWQAAPFDRAATQTPASQYGRAAVAQCASDVHVTRHAVPLALHSRSPHDIVAAGGQAPAPLHPTRKVSVAPAQLASRQVTATPGYVHAVADAALHAPAHELVPAQAPRAP